MMKRKIIAQFIYFFPFFILASFFRGYFKTPLPLVGFWIGGVVGLFLPFSDHLFYIFVFRPYELTSQRIKTLMLQKQYKEAIKLLADTAGERNYLIFHTMNFQFIFMILAFFVISSSANLFTQGLVLSFLLHLFIFNFEKYLNNQVLLNDMKTTRLFLLGFILALLLLAFLF